MILNGIKIFSTENAQKDLKNQVFLSLGSEHVEGIAQSGNLYDKNSYKPRKPWLPLNEYEENILIGQSRENLQPYKGVCLIERNEKFVENFEKLVNTTFESKEDIIDFQKSNPTGFSNLNQIIDDNIKVFCPKYKRTTPNLFVFNKPNCETSTIDSQTHKHVGLHIDSWDNLSINQTKNGNNRICFNLGSEDRYFMFINLSVKKILSMIKQKMEIPKDYNQNSLCRDFLRLYPDYSVIKLKVKPFEGYIAPTENIIHDGCTEGSSKTDITCTIRGNFWI